LNVLPESAFIHVGPARSDHLLPRRYSFVEEMTKAQLGKAVRAADEVRSVFK